jgi:hypothetical protein
MITGIDFASRRIVYMSESSLELSLPRYIGSRNLTAVSDFYN